MRLSYHNINGRTQKTTVMITIHHRISTKKTPPYQCGSKVCDLCLLEKVFIISADPDNLLNKRTELISKCRHRNKFLLANVKK